MKRKIVWQRVLILLGLLFAICLLGVAALFTLGKPLLSAMRASLWTADPERSRQAAQAMLDYQLPKGYTETKVLNIQGDYSSVIASLQGQPGNIIFFQSIVEGVRQNEGWRKRYEESWSNDLNGHRYQVRTVEIREMQVGGNTIPVRMLEGQDENGKPVKQAVCILPGKVGDVLVAVMSAADTWNFSQVETFFNSIQ
jgi:hypothetical protein